MMAAKYPSTGFKNSSVFLGSNPSGIMRHPQCFESRRSVRSWFTLLVAVLACTGTLTNRAAHCFADESPKAADATQERVFSGLQTGEETRPFKVLRVINDEPQELEVVKDTDAGVTLICFVHRMSNDDRVLFGLGLVDFYASQHQDLTSHFVLLSDDRNKMTKMIRAWQQGSFFTKSLVSLSADGAEGPGYYGLNRHVDMTVMVVKGNKVVDNLVFNAPNNRDLESIMVAVAIALEKPKPTLAEVQKELRAERQRQQDKRIKASPVFKLAPNEQLGRIMFGMVNARGNRSKNAARRSQQFLDWAGDSQEQRLELKKYCRAVLEGNFQLDQYARAAIQKLAEDENADGL